MHDARLGRFKSLDPLAPEYPHNSPYAFSESRVIDGVELEGLEKVEVRSISQTNDGKITVEASVDVQIKVLNLSHKKIDNAILQTYANSHTQNTLKAIKGGGSTFTDDINPMTHYRGEEGSVEYKFFVRNVYVQVIDNVDEINPGDMVTVLVDEIYKSTTPPDDPVTNPWIDPAGYAQHESGVSVLEVDRFLDSRSHIVPHEVFHNWGIEHSDHEQEGLMSYKNLESLKLQPKTQESLLLHFKNVAFQSISTGNCGGINSYPNNAEEISNQLNGSRKVDYDESKLR